MIKNNFRIFLLIVFFAFFGSMNKSTKAEDDPVEFIKNAKTPVHLHSLAGGDSLVHELPTMIGTWWRSISPPNAYPFVWQCIDQRENGIPGLNRSDWLKIQYGLTKNWIWVYVGDVTITLILSPQGTDDSTYVEFKQSWMNVGPGFVDSAIFWPVGDTIVEVWPEYGELYEILLWHDNEPFGRLSTGDDIDTYPGGHWTVDDVAIDILVAPQPACLTECPTMTQWGLIILAALIVASAVYIMLRRRRATVAA